MYDLRSSGLSHAYLDVETKGFSNVAIGLTIRAIGHGLKVAYVDVSNSASKFSNFLENLSLSYSFVKKFDRLSVDIYTFKKDSKIQKSVIPVVEFFSIDEKMFWNGLEKYDLIVFDNVSDQIDKFKIINFLQNRGMSTEVVFVFSDEKAFNEVKDNFNLVSIYNYEKKKLFINKGILNVTGDGKGKSTFGFGYLIRAFISKQDVKLVYFDKGGDFYGERFFFRALKQWSKENNLYGKFDFVATGLERFDGKKFRFENTDLDIAEAKEGLMLLKTALKKQTPVIAEELNTLVKTGLLNINEIMEVLSNVNYEVVVTGRYSPKEIVNISSTIVIVNEIKHYAKAGHSVRKGVDF